MYSDLPVLMLAHRCLSWSGFLGEHFNVRSRCLYFFGGCLPLPVNSILSTDGASFIYDGTPLVEKSVDRVRTSLRTHELSTPLLIDVLTGNPYPIRVYQLSSWSSRVPSRTRGRGARCPQPWPARPTGCSGVGAEEHRIVWWRSSQGMPTGRRPPPIAGNAIHDRSPSSERAQEQRPSPFTTSMTIFPLLPEPLYALISRTSRRCLIS